MIKTLSVGLIACVILGFSNLAEANTVSYWQKYVQDNYPQYDYSRSTRPTFRSFRNSSNRSTYRPTSTRTTNSSSRNTYRNFSPSYSSFRNTNSVTSSSGVVATVTPQTQSKYIYKITNDPVDLFNIGFRNNESTVRSTYREAINIEQLRFQITDNQGLSSDLSQLALVVDGQEFRFTRNGFVTLRFGNLRLAAGESIEIPVKVKVDDPSVFPRISGSFRVKLTDIEAAREMSQASVPVRINGRTTSDHVVFNPSSGTQSTSGQANFTSQTIFGRALGAGEKAFVLSTNLYASRDDFVLEELTVRNSFGNNVDSQIDRINLWDLSANKLVDSRKFVNGEATFKPTRSNQVQIARNGRVTLGFEVVVRDNIPNNLSENRLSLSLNASDIELLSFGAGRPVPDSSKNISFDAQTFTITGGGAPTSGGIAFSSVQPELVPTGNLTEVARFRIGNSGGGDLSVGRISLETILNGLEFPGGLSVDDADLKLVYNGNVINNDLFNVSSASGNRIVFDANSEVYINRGQSLEFSLLLKLNNSGNSDSNDSVSVRILGDTTLSRGTLSSVRSGNFNFIWSDHSGRPHTLTSSDWFSGFLLTGLPTNYFVNRRD